MRFYGSVIFRAVMVHLVNKILFQDLISELKTGLGLQWELLIKELLEDRGFADAMGVFDAMCVSVFSLDLTDFNCCESSVS